MNYSNINTTGNTPDVESLDAELAWNPGQFRSVTNIRNLQKGNAGNSGHSRPTLHELIETIRRPRNLPDPEDKHTKSLFFDQDWVEVRGIDMRWHLAKIERMEERLIKKWDYDEDSKEKPPTQFFYFFKDRSSGMVIGRSLDRYDLRASEEGLKAVFGMRPWLWQQYAFIRLEALLRFEQYHAADFEAINIYSTVRQWFNEWLNDGDNGDFAEKYQNEEEGTQVLLRHHLFTPFKLMERIRDDEQTWDFADQDITVYTYLAILGDGVLISSVCCLIQIALPILLLLQTLYYGTSDNDALAQGNPRFREVGGESGWDTFCNGIVDIHPGAWLGKFVLMGIILLYIAQVIPDTFYNFYNVAGVSGSTYSRLNSLRNIVYVDKKDDNFQVLGFKLDRWMNTAYINMLYMIMLFILFLTENVLDIILNALAINFIHEIDENIANATWFDRDFRWIKSGAIQLVFQANIDTKNLKKARKFCEKYGIEWNKYKELFDPRLVYVPSMKDLTQARRDEYDETFDEGRKTATRLRDEDEYLPHFGAFEKFLGFVGIYIQGQFHHYEDYRVWSRWQQVLFLPSIPRVSTEFEEESKQMYARTPLADMTPMRSFFWYILTEILSMKRLLSNCYSALTSSGTPWWRIIRFAMRFVEGALDWLTYALPIVFPPVVIIACLMFPYCY